MHLVHFFIENNLTLPKLDQATLFLAPLDGHFGLKSLGA
jgi:hypothetical protein